jgi:hypothetical protein
VFVAGDETHLVSCGCHKITVEPVS